MVSINSFAFIKTVVHHINASLKAKRHFSNYVCVWVCVCVEGGGGGGRGGVGKKKKKDILEPWL